MSSRKQTQRSAGEVTGWTILSAIIPGVGLLRAGMRRTGGIILAVFVLGVVALAGVAIANRQAIFAAAVHPGTLRVITFVIAVGALLWTVLLVASHLALRGHSPSPRRRLGGAFLVAVLVFAVAAPMAVAARYSYDQAALVQKVFKRQGDSKSATVPDAPDSWDDKPRLNVLLLGGDGGEGRVGVRTDTVIVASIDTASGDTTLFSLPRNTARMPFPEGPLRDVYPYGYTDGGDGSNAEYFLNAMYPNIPALYPDILGETDNLGADVMKLSVGEALGLDIDYYALVNLEGFEELINALGGVTVNINEYIAKGGNTDRGIPPKAWLSPGENQHLNGSDALWYARGRFGSDDFARMDRQRCVINAVIRQINPQTILTRYEAIARASGDIIYTDVPQEMLAPMVELATRAQSGNVRSVVFKNGVDGFISANPDFDLMREQVSAALGESAEPPADEPTPDPQDPATEQPTDSPDEPTGEPDEPTGDPTEPDGTEPSGDPSADPDGGATSENVDDACAYDAERAQEARDNPPYWVRE